MFVGRGISGDRGNGSTSPASPACIFASLSQKTPAPADGLDIAGGDVYRKCYNDMLERLSGAGADAMSDTDRAESERRQLLPTNFSDAMLDPIGRLVDRLWHVVPATLMARNSSPHDDDASPSSSSEPPDNASRFMDEETELIACSERLVTLRDAERNEAYFRNPEIIDRG